MRGNSEYSNWVGPRLEHPLSQIRESSLQNLYILIRCYVPSGHARELGVLDRVGTPRLGGVCLHTSKLFWYSVIWVGSEQAAVSGQLCVQEAVSELYELGHSCSLALKCYSTESAWRCVPPHTSSRFVERDFYSQPTGPNPLYHRDDLVVRPRAMGVCGTPCRTARGTLCSACTVHPSHREIGILLPNNQRQHRTLHIQKDVLPCALC